MLVAFVSKCRCTETCTPGLKVCMRTAVPLVFEHPVWLPFVPTGTSADGHVTVRYWGLGVCPVPVGCATLGVRRRGVPSEAVERRGGLARGAHRHPGASGTRKGKQRGGEGRTRDRVGSPDFPE